jgi:hypothetical protein
MTADSGMVSPPRAPGVPHATTVVVADLLAGSSAYCDTCRDGPPILVLDLGYTEIQLSMPDIGVTLDDLSSIDAVMEALAAFRAAVVRGLSLDVDRHGRSGGGAGSR